MIFALLALAASLLAGLALLAALAREACAILGERRAVRRALRSARLARPGPLGSLWDPDLDGSPGANRVAPRG